MVGDSFMFDRSLVWVPVCVCIFGRVKVTSCGQKLRITIYDKSYEVTERKVKYFYKNKFYGKARLFTCTMEWRNTASWPPPYKWATRRRRKSPGSRRSGNVARTPVRVRSRKRFRSRRSADIRRSGARSRHRRLMSTMTNRPVSTVPDTAHDCTPATRFSVHKSFIFLRRRSHQFD